MTCGLKSIFCKNLLLFFLYGGAQEFDHLATSSAEQMVVMRVIGKMLECTSAIFLNCFPS